MCQSTAVDRPIPVFAFLTVCRYMLFGLVVNLDILVDNRRSGWLAAAFISPAAFSCNPCLMGVFTLLCVRVCARD